MVITLVLMWSKSGSMSQTITCIGSLFGLFTLFSLHDLYCALSIQCNIVKLPYLYLQFGRRIARSLPGWGEWNVRVG